jgi:hypothetical protein
MIGRVGVAGRTGALALACGFVVLAGCGQTLFPEAAQRTPYERYQAFRGQDRQAKTTDAFGREQPDLRARLAPLEGP